MSCLFSFRFSVFHILALLSGRLSPFHLKVIINLFQEEKENFYGDYFLSFTQVLIRLVQVYIIELIVLAMRLGFHG